MLLVSLIFFARTYSLILAGSGVDGEPALLLTTAVPNVCNSSSKAICVLLQCYIA